MSIFTSDNKLEVATDEISFWERVNAVLRRDGAEKFRNTKDSTLGCMGEVMSPPSQSNHSFITRRSPENHTPKCFLSIFAQ